MEQQSSQPNEAAVLPSGEIEVRVRRNGEPTVYRVDLLELKLTCEEVEQQHSIQQADGRLKPTAEFLRALAGKIEGIGVAGCTPTEAWALWMSSAAEMEKLKNGEGGMLS